MLSKSESGCGFWAGFVPMKKNIDLGFEKTLFSSYLLQNDIQEQSDSLYDSYLYDQGINDYIQPCCPIMELHSQFNMATLTRSLDDRFFTHILNDSYGTLTIFLLDNCLINELEKEINNFTPTSEYICRMLRHCYKVNQKFSTRTFIVLESFGEYQPTVGDFDWDTNLYIHQMFHNSNYLFCHHQVVDFDGNEWGQFPLDEYNLRSKSPDYNYPYRKL